MDKRMIAALNVPGAFSGKVTNSANIGLSTQAIAALWNEANPDNPIALESAPEQ